MMRRMPGLVALSFVLVLSAAAPAVAHGGGHHERLIVAQRSSPAIPGQFQLVAIRPSDGQVRVLTSGHRDLGPDLSADGTRIVFERCLNAIDCGEIGSTNIWVMNADGTDAHPVTACDGSECLGSFDPSFSRDGQFITFSQDRLEDGENVQGIFIMRSDGTHLRRVTSSSPDVLGDGNASFSPDGRRLVFVRLFPDGSLRLMTAAVDGTDVRSILPDVSALAPTWSPDGRRIAFALTRPVDEGSGWHDLATVTPTGRHLRPLTDEQRTGRASTRPDYASTGRRLVYAEGPGNGCRIATIDDTGAHRRVVSPDDGACYTSPSW